MVKISQQHLIRSLVTTESLSTIAKKLARNEINPMQNLSSLFCDVRLTIIFMFSKGRALDKICL